MHRISLPDLDIAPLRNLVLHEDVEDYRVEGIMRRLIHDRMLKNPPIVGQHPGRRRLIVLDGASRVTAARRLGYPHLLVQKVEYPSAEIGLDRWNHLVVGMTLSSMRARATALEGIVAEAVTRDAAARALTGRTALACLRAPGQKPVLLRASRGQRSALRSIREFTSLYATDPGLHRVREDQVAFPEEWLGEERVLVMFPVYRQRDIVEFSLDQHERLPMGITRHTVPNRALRVYYPVSRLQSNAPLRQKRRDLHRFLEEKWERGQIRPYTEATTLYDE